MNIEQLIFVLKGEVHQEFGRRYENLEPFIDKGYVIKEFKPLYTDEEGVTTIMFLLEKITK